MNHSDGTQFAHDFPGVPDTTFFWNFSNKWLSEDGKDFTLIFTGSRVNDSWNTVRGSFEVAGTNAVLVSVLVIGVVLMVGAGAFGLVLLRRRIQTQ